MDDSIHAGLIVLRGLFPRTEERRALVAALCALSSTEERAALLSQHAVAPADCALVLDFIDAI